jgi:hypothetical protein
MTDGSKIFPVEGGADEQDMPITPSSLTKKRKERLQGN